MNYTISFTHRGASITTNIQAHNPETAVMKAVLTIQEKNPGTINHAWDVHIPTNDPEIQWNWCHEHGGYIYITDINK